MGRRRTLAMAVVFGAIAMTDGSSASSLDDLQWKNRVLVVVAAVGDPAAETQRRIFEASAQGMLERSIVLTEAIDDTARSRQIRLRLSAGARHFRVFLVGKDGHTALSSNKPLSAEYLFAQVDAMPMRRDEMRRGNGKQGPLSE